MAIFKMRCVKADTREEKNIYYNSSLSTLTWEDGSSIIQDVKKQNVINAPAKIEKGKYDLSTIKIQLGLSCNFECEYCSQRFVPTADETTQENVQPFVDNMPNWFHGGEDGFGLGIKFELWGGEPFVYWKTMKPLAEALYKKYPNSTMSIITNGSLLDKEKNDWIIKNNITIAISHDGPGQYVRGPDPLQDQQSKEAILDLFKNLAPLGKISFNAMVNSKNTSRSNIQEYFIDLITKNLGEGYVQYLSLGEGAFVDAYDEGGLANSLLDEEEDIRYRDMAYREIRDGKTKKFLIFNEKVTNFINGIENGRRIESLTQKCGMDKHNNIAVDLNGNVLTCQNVSSVSKNPSGISHHIGHINDLKSVNIATGTHWSDRNECPKCPVIHLCKGACLFLTGELWDASCNNAFSDNIIIFANIIEYLSGYIPIYIEGPQKEERKDIFWWVNGKPNNVRKLKKVIPINIIH